MLGTDHKKECDIREIQASIHNSKTKNQENKVTTPSSTQQSPRVKPTGNNPRTVDASVRLSSRDSLHIKLPRSLLVIDP